MLLTKPRHHRRHKSRRLLSLETLESRLLMSAVNAANVAWSTYFGGTYDDGLSGPAALAIDSDGNKIIGGWSESTALPSGTNSHTSGTLDAFVAKYDADGTLLWSTFIGGTDDDTAGMGLAVDSSGNTYITGFVRATDLNSALNSPHGSRDAFLAKVSPTGALLWTQYLGGSGDDSGRTVAVDGSGNAYVTGYTFSSDFVGPNGTASGLYSGNMDVFVAKVAPNGSLTAAFYFGGSGDDQGGKIAVNANGEILLTGDTSSTGLSHATNAFHGGDNDAFLARFDSGGTLQWMTYLGGSGAEAVSGGDTITSTSLVWSDNGAAVVAGFTESKDFPLATNKYGGKGDGFVCAVDPNGTPLWSVYLGGSSTDAAIDVALDPANNIVATGLMGFTSVTGNGMNAFVAKVTPDGDLAYMRQFGGSKNDYTSAIVFDDAGNAWLAGTTWSSDVPAADNLAPGGNLTIDPNPATPLDGFLARINASSMSQATRLVISTLPTTLTAGELPQIQVQLQYASGVLVTDDASTVTLSILTATNGTLGGTLSAAIINGVATFTDLALTTKGAYTLVATDAALSAQSKRLTINPDLTTGHIVIAQQPGLGLVGKALTPNLVIRAVDQYNNIITTEHSRIILSCTTGTFSGTHTVTLSSGSATFSNLVFKTAGNYTLIATPATTSTLANTSPVSYDQFVARATTTIPTLAVKAAGYTYGNTIPFTINLTANTITSIPFTELPRLIISDVAGIDAISITPSGQAKFTFPLLPAGTYTCLIRYAGDENHTAANGNEFTITINPAATSTSLATSTSSPVFGQTLTLTAAVKASTTSPRTGNVEFFDNGVSLGQTALNDANGANLATVVTATGSHHYTAVYLGDDNFVTSTSSSVSRTVSKDKTTTAITPSAASPLATNQTFNLDIQVSIVSPGSALLTNDLVTIKDNGILLGTLTLNSLGQGTLPGLTYTAPGTHSLQAIFAGDSNTLTSTSTKLVLTVHA